MHNAKITSRSNTGRNHHPGQYGKVHPQDPQNRGLKLNCGNNSSDNSMLKSEKERQRQEARAQREKSRVTAATPQEKNEAIFAVVQVSPTPGQDRFQISDILGDFVEVSRHYRSRDLIGVDHQPATPAPVAAAHIHDPDNYFPPPFSGSNEQRHSYAHRSQSHSGGSGSSKPRPVASAPSIKLPHQHHQKFVEEVKPSLKSGPGPGPGPGPGTKPSHRDVGLPLPTNPLGTQSMGRPRSHERVVKDPQVQKIMSEMNDLKSPLSAILQTPRPDHQSSFTFPAPSGLPASRDSSTANGSKPNNHLLQSKSKKSSERGTESSLPPKPKGPNTSDDVQLSEESDDEVMNSAKSKTGASSSESSSFSRQNNLQPPDNLNGVKNPPISPIKNTDDSSNSDDTSGTDSESSSSEEETKNPSPPPSPPPPDEKTWSLESIFRDPNDDVKNKEKVAKVGAKAPSETSKDTVIDTMPISPQTVDEPAPPVVTTVPKRRPNVGAGAKRTGSKKPVSSSLTTDDESSGNEEVRPSPKPQKRVAPYARPKPMIEPNLSSDSEDEPVPTSHRGRPHHKVQHQHRNSNSKSPKGPKRSAGGNHSQKPQKKKESVAKPVPRPVYSDSDSDDDEIIDVVTSTPVKIASTKKRSSASEQCITPSKKSQQKLPVNSEVLTQSARKKLTSVKSPTITEDVSRPALYQEPDKCNGVVTAPVSRHSKDRRRKPMPEIKVEVPLISPSNIRNSKRSKKAEGSSNPNKSNRKHQKISNNENVNSQLNSDDDVKPKLNERLVMLENSDDEGRVSHNGRLRDHTIPLYPSPYARKSQNGLGNGGQSPFADLHFDNGVPRLLCSIPVNLIDNLPVKVTNNSLKGCLKEEKINKEVLEMRTSAGKNSVNCNNVNSNNSSSVRKREITRNSSKSPPNEDETKLRAICSIYRKRPSSVEPDKMKQETKNEVQEPIEVKPSPVVTPKREEISVKSDQKMPVYAKEETKHSSPPKNTALEAPLKRHGSSSSLSSLGTTSSVSSHSKKHKKDKKKEKRKDKERDKDKYESPNRTSQSKNKRRSVSPPPTEVSKKRLREESSSQGVTKNSKHLHEKAQKAFIDDDMNGIQSPSKEGIPGRDERDSNSAASHFQHPRSSQRNPSEERFPPSGAGRKSHPQGGCQFSPEGVGYGGGIGVGGTIGGHMPRSNPSSLLPVNDYSEHDSEDDAVPMNESHEMHVCPSVGRDKALDDPHHPGHSGGNTSEYHSLPSSEHGGSSAYRSGEERISPLLVMGGPHQQPMDSYPSSMMNLEVARTPTTPHADYHNSLINQDTITPSVPIYMSYFERRIPEISKDNTQYLSKAKELKHQADKERHRVLQTIQYLEAVLYFILTGESMECDPGTYAPAYTMFSDTFKLIRHVSLPIFKAMGDKKDPHYSRLSVILAILSLRCQSLLSLKMYRMKRSEIKEAQLYVGEYLKTIGRQSLTVQPSATPSGHASSSAYMGGGTPSGASGSVGPWGGSHRSAANNSPSSLSPTPSPAGSVGSDGSQSSSGYSTEGARGQRGHHPAPMGATPPQMPPTVSMPADVHAPTVRFCQISLNLYNAHEMWQDADDHVFRSDIKDFFIELDHCMGPLTLHSSLRELVKYVQKALDKLKNSI